MTPRRALARIRYELVSLLLECAFAVAVLAALAAAVPMLTILAAHVYALATAGQWRGFPLSELIEVLRIDSVALPIDEWLLALPAALVLFVVVLILWLLAAVVHRLSRRERARFLSVKQRALIGDIERELEAR